MSTETYWKEMARAIELINLDVVQGFKQEIIDCSLRGGMLITAGNGGSASTAEHATCDLSKGLSLTQESNFGAICLNSNMSLSSAYANDESYENALSKMFIHIADAEDLLLLISGSGNSKNIIKLAEVAKEKSVKTLALTGFDGGELSKFADLEIRVDSFDMQIVENMHLAILHSILKV